MLGRLIVALALTLASANAAAQGPDLVFAVTEGVTYQATPKEIRDRFAALAEVLSRSLHRNVRTVIVPAYDDLRAGLARQEYDVAFVHPAHVAMAEIKAGRYKAAAWTAGFTDYSVSLMMTPEQPLKAIGDLKGRTIVTPDPDSITAVMVRAMFREQKFGNADVKVVTTRYQDAVPFYLEHGFAQVGATAAKSVVKTWTDKGGKVLTQSRPVPIKQVIVSTRLSPAEQDRIREELLTLGDTKPGKNALAMLGYRGFAAPAPELEATTIAWLGL
ncbi:MAG: phosphate/phosphite/phosphonate ABC transporter substrate-binding protein [Pseudomonadota bacterium]|nr:phosphate/phosphite/phosphonate ABC transporter substrate-binding protein [Pseudomonadota bacterium]